MRVKLCILANLFENDAYVVLDIETTGLNPDEHEIIEIFAFLVEKERITNNFTDS